MSIDLSNFDKMEENLVTGTGKAIIAVGPTNYMLDAIGPILEDMHMVGNMICDISDSLNEDCTKEFNKDGPGLFLLEASLTADTDGDPIYNVIKFERIFSWKELL